MKMKMQSQNRGGFTLIELLIVIGLMGALVALVLPKLTADRREALMDVSEYNKAGTIRALYEYEEMMGSYPNDMHSGLEGFDRSDSNNRMDGMQKSMAFNISDGSGAKPTSIRQLTTNMVASLNAAGITSLCYSNGFNSRTLAVDDYVVMSCHNGTESPTAQWLHKDFTPYVGSTEKGKVTIEGRTLDAWIGDMNGGANNGVIIAFWITPTVNWEAGSGDNTDWTKGSIQLGLSMEGQAPVPTQDAEGGNAVEFAYYSVHFLVDDDDTDGIQAAKLIGVMCGKPLNP